MTRRENRYIRLEKRICFYFQTDGKVKGVQGKLGNHHCACFAIALLAGVLPAIIGSRSTSDDGDITGDGEALVGTVYFADTTGITTGKDYEGFLSGLGVKINDCGKDADIQSLTEKVKGENKSLLIVISENKIGYDIYASRPGDESVSSGTANGFGETFKSVLTA